MTAVKDLKGHSKPAPKYEAEQLSAGEVWGTVVKLQIFNTTEVSGTVLGTENSGVLQIPETHPYIIITTTTTLKRNKFIYLFLAASGLRCCVWAFSSCGKWGLLFVAVRGLLTVVASHCRARALGVWASLAVARRLQQLWRTGSVVVARRLNCSAARGIFPDQGSNPCPLHWQADS